MLQWPETGTRILRWMSNFKHGRGMLHINIESYEQSRTVHAAIVQGANHEDKE